MCKMNKNETNVIHCRQFSLSKAQGERTAKNASILSLSVSTKKNAMRFKVLC